MPALSKGEGLLLLLHQTWRPLLGYHSEPRRHPFGRTRTNMRALASAVLLAGFVCSIIAAYARQTQNGKSQTGKTQGQFLVASRDLSDPFFRQSVVLMLPIKEGPLLVGLIVNKPTKIKLRDVFPNSPALQKTDAMAYFGGPVDYAVRAPSAIFRAKTPPGNATLVFGDVYVSFDPDAIAAVAENPQQGPTLRVFLGRAQWAPEQLEDEAAHGAWHSVNGAADSIFSTLPEALWRSLIDRAEPRPVVQSDPPFSLVPVSMLDGSVRDSPN